MEQFLEFVKVDTGTNLVGMGSSATTSNVPKDATVHELTSNTIWFIEHLYEHYNVIADIMLLDLIYVGQFESITTQRILSTEERNKTLLGLYISKFKFDCLTQRNSTRSTVLDAKFGEYFENWGQYAYKYVFDGPENLFELCSAADLVLTEE